MKQLITIKQACKILAVGDTKLREIIKKDPGFPAYLIGGRWKIDLTELDVWIEAQRSQAVTPAPKSSRRKSSKPNKPLSRVFEVFTPGWNPSKQTG